MRSEVNLSWRRRALCTLESKRRIWLLAVVLAVAAFTLSIPAASLAVHDLGLFELDTAALQRANTADDSASGAPYDWESIFNSSGQQILSPTTEPRLLIADFNADYVTPDDTYFASSNKDIDDVSAWQCGSINNPTPKDEIANAYAALFLNSADNHVILYAGAERDNNNGNSFMGFWIFKSAVGCSSPGTFSGAHTDGDILVLSNFTGGGTHPLVEVYEWDNGALSLIDSGNFCHAAGPNDDVCGEVNAQPFQTTWASHNTPANPLAPNEFLEIGLDLTSALSLGTNSVPCFARFQAETRSSQETTATLKDFASGRFNTCSSSTVTTPRAGGTSVSGAMVAPGTQVNDRAVVTGSALAGTAPAPTGTVSFFVCGPQPTKAQAQCSTGGTAVGSAVSLPAGSANPKTVDSATVAPTALGWYCFRADYSGNSNYTDGSSDSSLNECFQVQQLTPTVATDIHNASHTVVTTVAAGTTVHDFITVSGAGATPTETATLDWFTNGACAPNPQSTSAALTLDGTGHVEATSFAKGPLAAGLYSFKATYGGNTIYTPAAGPCEPLRVVDANISITPQTATNHVGDPHTFTAHVNKNDGTGFTNASSALVSFTIESGPGTLSSGNVSSTSCSTNANGDCTIVLNSSTTGVTTVKAHTTLLVNGVSLTRHTDATGSNSGPAAKRWVNAKISIAPSATNRIGQAHTFTVTVWKDLGDGNAFVKAVNVDVDFTLTDSNGAAHTAPTGTCTNAGANTDGNGECTITFTSNSTGKVTAHASSTLSLAGSAPFTVSTNGVAPNSADAVKTFVNAKISITPSTATNRVGDSHTFTVTLWKDLGNGAGFVKAQGEDVDFTLTDAKGAIHTQPTGSCTNAGANTDANGQCTITFNSNTTGTVTAHASSTLTLAGLPVSVATDGIGLNSADAVKTYVNAKIAIAPSATNRIGQPHTFTVTLMKDTGDGTGFRAAANEHVNFSLTDANGAVSVLNTAQSTCDDAGANTNASGQCTIVFNSSSTGKVTGHASATLTIGSATFSVATDGAGLNSADAVKTYVNAKIAIAPSATNRIGQAHTFTVTLMTDVGDGAGFRGAAGEHVNVSLTDSNGANSILDSGASTCDDAGPNTDVTGKCTIVFTSNSTGKVTGHASSTLTIGTTTFTVATDGTGLNSADAVKTYVNAKIAITPPTATNRVGDAHTFTVTLMKDSGNGASFQPAAGEHVDFTLTDSNGASSTLNAAASTCDNAGANTDGNGQCTIVFNSNATGKVTGHASATLTIAGLAVSVQTDGTGLNSGNAVKTYVNAKISIAPTATNRVGDPHTFTVTLSKDTGNGTGFQPAAPEHVDFTLTDSNGASSTLDAAASTCDNAGANTDANGRCTIVFTSISTGKVTGHASSTLSLAGLSVAVETDGTGLNSGNAVKTYVNAKIAITPPTATNRISDPHTFTVTLSKDTGNGAGFQPAAGEHVDFSLADSNGANSILDAGSSTCDDAGANTDANGRCTIVFTSNSTGKVTGHASSTVTITGLPVSVATDGTGLNSGNALKTFVNAKIAIASSATNRVGDPHTFTVTLSKDTGNGAGFQPAAGEHVNFTLTDSNGANSTLNALSSTCDDAGANTDANGRCTIVFNSNATGKVTGHASSTLTIGTATFTVATDGTGLNSAAAVKTYVNAKISIAASATNEVGDPHTFTVTLSKDTGSAAGYGPAVGEHVDFTLTDSNGAASVLNAAASTCDNAGGNTDANGQCTIVFNSSTAGKVTAHASSTLSVAGSAPIKVETDGTGGNSGNAVKTYVDANIQISPQTATNPLSTNHTLTGHVNVNIGAGAFVNAQNGTTITFSLTNAGGATASFVGPNSCTTSGGTGSCDVVINSSTAGTTTIKASTDVTVGGLVLHRETGDAKVGDSNDATKKWAAARISIAPDATNEIGDPHTFVVTLEKDTGTGTYVPAVGEHVDFTLINSLGAAAALDAANSTCDNAGANTDANGQCTITFTSPTAGKVTAHASATLLIGGATVLTQTNGAGGSSSNAVKTFVDANIQIAADGVNRVGDTHTFTAHVNVNDGTGFAPASGKLVIFSIDTGPGVLSNGNVSSSSCTTNANGNCSIDLDSATTGVTKVSAHTTVLVGGVTLTRNTDGKGANSAAATKTWVNAKISIAPDATNEIGDPHTFTVTVRKDTGTGTFVAAQGAHVDVTLTDSKGAASVLDTAGSTCDDNGANTDANGQCTITFTSQTPGKVTAHASSTLAVAGSAQFTVETDGVAPNGGDAVKTFVNANIQISPQTATNPLATTHTLTGHVNVNTGSGAYTNAPNGTTITFSLTNTGGATASFVGPNSCTTAGGTGSCDVVISSSTSGTTTIKASTDVTVGGVAMHRATGDAKVGDSDDATKKWATAKIEIAPNATHEVGQPHTFTVTLSKDTGTGTFVPAPGEHVSFTLTDSNGAVHTAAAGTCTNAGANTNASGECTITITSNTAGKVTAHASATLTIGGATIPVETDGNAPNSGNAVATFVDANIEINPQEATNPLNTTHTLTGHVMVNDGSGTFVNAPVGTKIDFSIVSGPGSFVGPASCTTTSASGSCTAVITSSTTGTSKIRAATNVTVGGVAVHRESNDGKAGDSPDAAKLWASAKITIAPNTTHEVGQSHTFTVTLLKDTTGTFVPAAGEHVGFTLTDGSGASHTSPTGSCTGAGANTDANGQCTITFTSNVAGTVTGSASATLSVSGATITVTTNGIAPNSGTAVATFVDANIQITPATAINPIGTTHTLTGHVNVNTGSGGYGNAPNGTSINFALAGPGTFVGPSSCTTTSGTGSCAVVISSSTVGKSTIRAKTDVAVGGVTLHRESGDAKAGDSADATKLWADNTARTDILNAGGGVVTTVVAGTIVHDKVFVARSASTDPAVPNPTGNVIFHRYATIDCTGASTNQTVALTPGSPSSAITADFAPTSNMSYRAEYLGDANYPARLADCEPLTVTPVPNPAIAIVKNPKGQTVAVGGTATFTITVTNAGNTVLTDVTVSDPLSPNCNRTKADIPALASMDPGATITYNCTKTNVRASFDNVATVTGTPPSGPNVSAIDTAPVKAAPLKAPPKKKKTIKKKKPKVISHKKPKATG